MHLDFSNPCENCTEAEMHDLKKHIEKQDLRIKEIRHQFLVTGIITSPVAWN